MRVSTSVKNLAASAVVLTIFSGVSFAEGDEAEPAGIESEVLGAETHPSGMVNRRGEKQGSDLDALAEEMINPLSDLWFMAVQNDTTSYTGDFDGGEQRIFNSLKLQPVMSVPLTEDYNLVLRPVIQIQSYESPDLVLKNTVPPITDSDFGLDFDRVNGLGDTLLLASVGPAEPSGKYIFAGGATFIIPTATDDELAILQSNTWAMGPSATGVYIGDHWIIGGFAQHWFGIGNKTQKVRVNIPANGTNLNVKVNGDDLNLTDFQYILRYRYSAQTNIGMAPNISVNWNESGSDRFTVPVGIGFDTMAMLGPLPVKWGVEMQGYVNQPDDFGPVWNLRVFFVPIIPNPFKR